MSRLARWVRSGPNRPVADGSGDGVAVDAGVVHEDGSALRAAGAGEVLIGGLSAAA